MHHPAAPPPASRNATALCAHLGDVRALHALLQLDLHPTVEAGDNIGAGGALQGPLQSVKEHLIQLLYILLLHLLGPEQGGNRERGMGAVKVQPRRSTRGKARRPPETGWQRRVSRTGPLPAKGAREVLQLHCDAIQAGHASKDLLWEAITVTGSTAQGRAAHGGNLTKSSRGIWRTREACPSPCGRTPRSAKATPVQGPPTPAQHARGIQETPFGVQATHRAAGTAGGGAGYRTWSG